MVLNHLKFLIMKKFIVALMSFADYADGKLLEFASAVIAALTGNSNFTKVNDPLAALTNVYARYARALDAARHGSSAQVAAKNVLKSALIVALRNLCSAVNYEQKGNREALLTSGFAVSKDASTPVVLAPIKKMTVNYGDNPGQLEIVVKKGEGTRSMVYQFTTDAEITAATRWNTLYSTESKCTLSELPIGHYVTIRVLSIGTRRQSIISAPVKKLVA